MHFKVEISIVIVAFVEYELLKEMIKRGKKMLVLWDVSKCQRVDQAKKNTFHHHSRMFSIKGILV